jgi:hypothetical protein
MGGQSERGIVNLDRRVLQPQPTRLSVYFRSIVFICRAPMSLFFSIGAKKTGFLKIFNFCSFRSRVGLFAELALNMLRQVLDGLRLFVYAVARTHNVKTQARYNLSLINSHS